MSDFKEKAGKFANLAAAKAKDLAAMAATKTKQVGRIAKLNVDIASQRDAIKHAYTEIGKLYYETKKGAPEEFFEQLFQQVDEAMAAINAMEAEITQLKTAQNGTETDFESVVEAEEEDAGIEVEIVTDEPEASAEEPVETPVEPPVEAPAEPPIEPPVVPPVEAPAEAPATFPTQAAPVEENQN